LQIFWFCAGIACIFVALLDAFQTVISPRRATGRFRITRLFFIVTWWPWSRLATRISNPRKRETALSFYGPASLLLLIVVRPREAASPLIEHGCAGPEQAC
jgi:hypothetical protein